MLIHSPRFKPGDTEHWRRMQSLDARWCRTSAFARKVDRAHAALLTFVERHESRCYVGVSWGKDSVVVAHMVMGLAPSVPMLHIEWPRRNPDSAQVEAACGIIGIKCKRYSPGDETTFAADFAAARRVHGLPDAHISGVRASESSQRAMRHRRWGELSPSTCAPLSSWRAEDVFAYLYAHDLPIHPAYAMTLGGRLDRGRIRVDDIGDLAGSGVGRTEWERAYYPEFFT